MAQRFLVLLCILFCFASCGTSKSSGGRVSNGDKAAPAYFPRRVVVQICQQDPTIGLEIIDVLTRNLMEAGIEVVDTGGLNDGAAICGGGAPSENMRRSLRDDLNIDGVFVGTIEQRRVEPFLLTRFDLRLMGNPRGDLIWTTHAKTDQLAAWADAKAAAVKTTVIAVESFKQEFLGNSKGTSGRPEKEPKR